jgi:hypothetical protein
MMRSIPLLAVALLACCGMAGCTACQGANDYCGPLPDEPCDFFYRRNSILGGDLQTRDPEAEQQQQQQAAPGQENVPTPAPEQNGETPAPEPMPPEGDLPAEMDLPPDTGEPADSEPPPSEGDLPPGASLRPYKADPYSYQPPKRSRGLLSSLFGR